MEQNRKAILAGAVAAGMASGAYVFEKSIEGNSNKPQVTHSVEQTPKPWRAYLAPEQREVLQDFESANNEGFLIISTPSYLSKSNPSTTAQLLREPIGNMFSIEGCLGANESQQKEICGILRNIERVATNSEVNRKMYQGTDYKPFNLYIAPDDSRTIDEYLSEARVVLAYADTDDAKRLLQNKK